ncbi:MAG: PQQ-binding-like beta-propeller repeat protein [Verrucomicrobia bacterium]|nr:PQQ-binding-like beta-propeller repeat protein [Verrucomicrobiota bacterium]
MPNLYLLRCSVRFAFCLTFLLSLWVGAGWAQISVLTQHNDNSRTGANLNETSLNTSNVNVSTFGKLFSMPVDGFIFAQPLYLPNVNMLNSGTHNVLFVATAHDSVYAFDADTGAEIWQESLGTPVPSSGNILVEVGIISTPVIDPSTSTLYVVAKTLENSVQIFRLHALDILQNGAEKLGGPIEIIAQYPGSAIPNDGAGHVQFDALKQIQRSALTLVNGVLYMAFASLGDHTPFHGWVLAYSAANLQQLATYNTTPNGEEGGIWMSGQGLVADSNNNVYCLTGNSAQTTENSVGDYGESFLKLGLSGNALSVLDFFKAHNYDTLNTGDLDLGSGGAVAIPGTAYIVGGGKQGLLYLVNTNGMGGLHSPDQVVQEFKADNGLWGAPVFWNNPSSPTLYVWGVNDSLKAFTYNPTTAKFNTPFAAAGSVKTPSGLDPCAALSVSSNQSVAGSGIVWATIPLADPDHTTVRGKLDAFDATNVGKELWSSLWNAARDDYGNWAKFVAPTVANGKVYVATDSHQVCAYGLNPTQPTTSTFGETAILPALTVQDSGKLWSQRADNTQAGTLQSISIYVSSGQAGTMELGLYDNSGSGGGPGKQLASTAMFTVAQGWNTQPVITPIALPVGTYYLAFELQSSAVRLTMNNSGSKFYQYVVYGPFPSTFGSATSGVGHRSFYGTVSHP